MTTRWLYTPAGQPAYYQDGDYIYSKNGGCEFSISDGWWYPMQGGPGAYYVSDGWVYTLAGKPSFYFG